MVQYLKYLEGGIALACLGVIIYIVKLFVGVISNHISDSTKTNEGLKMAIQEMLLFLKIRNGKK